MKRLHLILGLCTIAAFIGTGVYLKLALPELIERDHALRFTHRANHVYLLLAGLVNVVAGIYLAPHPKRWRRAMQSIGSGALLAAPAVLFIAFLLEAPSVSAVRPFTSVGLLIAFAGTLAHLFGIRRRVQPGRP